MAKKIFLSIKANDKSKISLLHKLTDLYFKSSISEISALKVFGTNSFVGMKNYHKGVEERISFFLSH